MSKFESVVAALAIVGLRFGVGETASLILTYFFFFIMKFGIAFIAVFIG